MQKSSYVNRIRKIVLAICFLPWISMLLIDHASAAPATNEGLNSFIQKLNKLTSMQAEFVQITRASNKQELQRLEGTLKVAKPGKMYWRTKPPFSQLVVADGEVVWMYDEDLEQVSIRNMEQRLQDTPALLLSGKASEISKNFTVSQNVSGSISRYQLMPLDQSQLFEKIEFQYQGDTLESMRIYDAAGQITDIVFSNIQLNVSIDPHDFIFVVPEGVDVIDGRHDH